MAFTKGSTSGEKNCNWKGGFRKHSNGYRWILFKGEYILEHRHIMQQFLCRRLTRREQVHHKNGNKLDNKIENLELVDLAEHVRQHHREGLYKPMGWARHFAKCRRCGTNRKKHRSRGFCTTCIHLI